MLFRLARFLQVRIADAGDMACMKISAVSSRGTKRDFVDLYASSLRRKSMWWRGPHRRGIIFGERSFCGVESIGVDVASSLRAARKVPGRDCAAWRRARGVRESAPAGRPYEAAGL